MELASVRLCEHVSLNERSVTGMRMVLHVCQDGSSWFSPVTTTGNFVNKHIKPTTTASCRPAVERGPSRKASHPSNLAAKDADTPIPRVRPPSNGTGGTTCTRKLLRSR